MPYIFICYGGNPKRAEKLREHLIKAGYTAHMDKTTVFPGERLKVRLSEKIGNAKVVIVIWSVRAFISYYTPREARIARSQNKLISVMDCQRGTTYRIIFALCLKLFLFSWNIFRDEKFICVDDDFLMIEIKEKMDTRRQGVR